MTKPKLILHSKTLSNCACQIRALNHEFEIIVTHTEAQFLQTLKDISADIVVLCFPFAEESNIEELLRLDALSGPIPVLVCTKIYNPNFIRLAAQRGIDHFLLCDMEREQLQQLIFAALRGRGLRAFLESYSLGRFDSSPYVGKIINEIIHAFPHRLTIREVARRLGITVRRLQMICREAFGRPFTQLMRHILVFQALNMIKNTNLDNTEIALELDLADESSLARIFRKELGCNMTEARKRLVRHSPEELMK